MTMKNESGRSMVEMLGVLAIIGVLSIGGIAGYTMAMNRYRANEIIDAASKIGIIAMTKNDNSGNAVVANLTDIGSPTVPCVTTTVADNIKGYSNGKVEIALNGSCSGIASIITSIGGSKIAANGCNTDNGTCTINFAS